MARRLMFDQQKDPSGRARTQDSLYRPTRDGHTTGPYDGHVMKSSLYTKAMMSDATRAVSIIAADALLVAGVKRLRSAGA